MSTLYKDVPCFIASEHHFQKYCQVEYSKDDKAILRDLGKKYADIASLPTHEKTKTEWDKMNSLKSGRTMVWINEVCWNEVNINGELDLKTSTIFAQRIEQELRRRIYEWEHIPCDIVIDPKLYSPKIISNTGIGIDAEGDIVETDSDNVIVSRHFNTQIKDEDDIEKIKDPIIKYHKKETQDFYEAYKDIFAGIIDTDIKGCPGFLFAPWDDIVTYTGVQDALMDLIMRPKYIHKLIGRLVDAYLNALNQYESLGLLSSNNSSDRVGSGAYGHCGDLKSIEGDKTILCKDMWGSTTPQIFSDVSPAMHKEFALEYEKKWLERFGLSYYGCCEPLHNKIDILSEIPNLRKISISPWADRKTAAEKIKGKYVASIKPNPAILAAESWDLDAAREDVVTSLKYFKGCDKEIVLKDISTIKKQPHRLWEWAKMAKEEVEKYS